jgi:ATP-dependent Lon protease
VTVIHKALKQPDGSLRIVAQGLGRFRIVELVQTEPYLKARIEAVAEDESGDDVELQALVRSVTSLFENVVALSPTLPDELVGVIANVDGPGALADLVAATLPNLSLPLKQELLETISIKERLSKLATALGKEAEVLQLGSKIQSEVQSEMSKTQREYYLREQLKAIQKELGEGDDRMQEIDTLREKIEAAGMPDEARGEALRELDRPRCRRRPPSTRSRGRTSTGWWRCRGSTRRPMTSTSPRPGRSSTRTMRASTRSRTGSSSTSRSRRSGRRARIRSCASSVLRA